MAPKAAAAPKGPKYADIVKEAISSLKVSLVSANSKHSCCWLAAKCALEALQWIWTLRGSPFVLVACCSLYVSPFTGEGRF